VQHDALDHQVLALGVVRRPCQVARQRGIGDDFLVGRDEALDVGLKGPDAFCDRVDGQEQLLVLGLEGGVEGEEMLGGIGLLVGLVWLPAMWLSSGGLAVLMMLGVWVRARINDSLLQTLPALVLLLVNGFIRFASWP
jgi:hypothetical protein